MTVRVGTARGSFGANSNQFFGPLICSLIETNTLSGVNPSGCDLFHGTRLDSARSLLVTNDLEPAWPSLTRNYR